MQAKIDLAEAATVGRSQRPQLKGCGKSLQHEAITRPGDADMAFRHFDVPIRNAPFHPALRRGNTVEYSHETGLCNSDTMPAARFDGSWGERQLIHLWRVRQFAGILRR